MVSELLEHNSQLLSFIGKKIIYPNEDDSEEEDQQYMATLDVIMDQYLPEMKHIMKANNGTRTRGLLSGLAGVVGEQSRVMLTFMTNGIFRMKSSGLSGIAELVNPFVELIRKTSSGGEMIKGIMSAMSTLEQGVNTLNEVTSGAIEPLTDLSVALNGLNTAKDVIFGETGKPPKSLIDYLIHIFVIGSSEDSRVKETLTSVCKFVDDLHQHEGEEDSSESTKSRASESEDDVDEFEALQKVLK